MCVCVCEKGEREREKTRSNKSKGFNLLNENKCSAATVWEREKNSSVPASLLYPFPASDSSKNTEV